MRNQNMNGLPPINEAKLLALFSQASKVATIVFGYDWTEKAKRLDFWMETLSWTNNRFHHAVSQQDLEHLRKWLSCQIEKEGKTTLEETEAFPPLPPKPSIRNVKAFPQVILKKDGILFPIDLVIQFEGPTLSIVKPKEKAETAFLWKVLYSQQSFGIVGEISEGDDGSLRNHLLRELAIADHMELESPLFTLMQGQEAFRPLLHNLGYGVLAQLSPSNWEAFPSPEIESGFVKGGDHRPLR